MALIYRRSSAEEAPAFERARALANGHHVTHAELSPEALVPTLARREIDRSLVATDGDEIVATSLAYTFATSVPGEGREVPTAGLAGISVVPTHRRRGILRELMRRNLDDARGRGEALSILWPSESAIYRRFGFGAATTTLTWSLPRAHARLLPDLGDAGSHTVRILAPEPAKVCQLVAPVYAAARRTRPAMFDRTPAWWEHRSASAAGAQVWIAVDGPGGVEAYAAYSVDGRWESDGPANHLWVGELVATSTNAELALWRYLLDIDLVRSVSAWGRPPDETLPHLLVDPRRLDRRVQDGAWARVVDVGLALAARAYALDLDLVVEVRDRFCAWNEGRWRLEASAADGTATCSAVDFEPDLSLDVAELGSVYLGGVSWSTLWRAGLVVEHRAGAAACADAAFTWSPAPWAVTWF